MQRNMQQAHIISMKVFVDHEGIWIVLICNWQVDLSITIVLFIDMLIQALFIMIIVQFLRIMRPSRNIIDDLINLTMYVELCRIVPVR